MTNLIDKDALVAELKRRIQESLYAGGATKGVYLSERMKEDSHILSFIDTLEVKKVEEYKQPEYSRLETIYQCGKKPRWNVGDTLAYYEFYSDREGEHVLGKIIKVEFINDEEDCDWYYTFEDGCVSDEQSLLEDETYKKN